MAHYNIELKYDSRTINAHRTGVKQQIVIAFKLDETLIPQEAADYTTLGIDPDFEFLNHVDDVIALQHAYNFIPFTRILPDADGVKQVLVLDTLDLEDIGPNTWKATASYVYDRQQGLGGSVPVPQAKTLPYIRIGFNIGGGTKKVYKSLEVLNPPGVLSSTSPLPGVPDCEGAIGMTEESIEGVEVPDASMSLQITAYYLPQYVTLAFARLIRNAIAGPRNYGTYNHETWMGFEAGEVQLRSASGSGTVVDVIPITFELSIKANVTDQPDENFPNITMKGHDLLDYAFFQKWDGVGKVPLFKPDVRYLHRIADPYDYTTLSVPEPEEEEAP